MFGVSEIQYKPTLHAQAKSVTLRIQNSDFEHGVARNYEFWILLSIIWRTNY